MAMKRLRAWPNLARVLTKENTFGLDHKMIMAFGEDRMTTAQETRHSRITRWLHGGLAIAIVIQLLTSAFMSEHHESGVLDPLFVVHQYAGLAALFLVCAFFLLALVRRRGTPFGRLLPWFSSARRADLYDDVSRHAKALMTFRLPDYHEDAALPSAIHGLGLCLMAAMAGSGAIWFAAQFLGFQDAVLVRLVMAGHSLLGNVVWAYLIGHAGLAVLHHWMRQASLTEMWSFRS